MAADMDIDMDIDMGFTEQDLIVQDIEIVPESEPTQQVTNELAPNDSTAADALQPTPTKVHLRGVDKLTTNDIKAFASEYFSTSKPTLEWIDDTSANLVYQTSELAQEALVAFSAIEIIDVSQIPLLQTVPAKSFPLHPQTNLEVRLAVLGDRKQPGARERSRFYLFNPEHDPAEWRKKGPRGGNRYRDRDDGGYRSQRYDDREQRKRQLDDEDAGFTANLYDDDEAALNDRRNRSRHGSSSSSSFDGRDGRQVRIKRAAGKELFPERGDRGCGRLRDRSASPIRDRDGDREADDARSRRRDIAAAANRQKAQMIKAKLRETIVPKELFPNKNVNHRRSDVFDAADATAELMARQMLVPFMDGGNDNPSNTSLPLASRISKKSDVDSGRLNIRGAARPTRDFSIKGAAADGGVKELFPSGGNIGKELFSDRLEGRGRRRQKAEDLFH